MKLNLIECLPDGREGKKTLLPKQQEFFNTVLFDNKSKYVAYIGGIGSGKTVIGSLTFLAMIIQAPGDYLIGRQHMPELKKTSYKTFLDMIPPELILEHRVADAMVKVKANGGVANVYFAGLEDFNKFKSMNLNAFWIDESDQISEEAFMMLQGRLRGRHWRKGIVTSNPAGHNWCWRWFFDKSHIKDPAIQNLFKLIKAPSTENIHLPDEYIDTMMATWSQDRIEREIMGSFDSFEGKIFEEFKPEVHVIQPFAIPKEWPKFIGIDHGLRNPAAWVYGAIGKDGEIYIYREYYKTDKLIKDICSENLALCQGEKFVQAVIDPSTNRRNGQNGVSDLDEYYRWIPKDFPLTTANNNVETGIDRVKQYMRLKKNGKPHIYVFNSCTNLISEISQYRYEQLKPHQADKRAEKETPVKIHDHAIDALRYLVMLLPEPYKEAIHFEDKLKYNSLERSLYKELQSLKGKKRAGPADFGI